MLKSISGKIAVSVILIGLFVAGVVLYSMDHEARQSQIVKADTATTTVTVLNTPPAWTVDAQEAAPYITATPANVGSNVSWTGTATDPNNDNFYLLICKANGAPIAGTAGAPPTCNGGASNQYAVSAATQSGAQATATYIAQSSDPESNIWYAFVCDNNAGNEACNAQADQGTGNTASPFIVNHRPNFSVISNNSPKIPGAAVQWTATASDPDSLGGADTVNLFVCKSNDFTGSACGPGGTYCSAAAAASNPSCSYTLPVPIQDHVGYPAYVYMTDNHGFAASGGSEATNSSYAVSHVNPTITASTISLLNFDTSTPNLTLVVPNGQTTGFRVTFTAASDNGCQNYSSNPEFTAAAVNVYRSGIGMANCQASGQYNSNNCYPNAVGSGTWNVSCTQDAGSCTGPNSRTANYTCTFPLWYNADPTDGATNADSQFYNQDWAASAQVADYTGATSTWTEGTTHAELVSFLAYQMPTPAIAYAALSPGQKTDPLVATTSMLAIGNVGLDETLYGSDMCVNYPSCAVGSPTSTIAINNQRYSVSSVAFSSATALAANPGALLSLGVPKTTATSTPATKNTYWGINVPGTITYSGAYTGQNTFIGVKSPATTW